MGGSSSQVVGYRYCAKFAAFIGNRIERLIAINFDSRGWQIGKTVRSSQGTDYMYIKKPGLYGENEGGVSGIVTIKKGEPNQSVACELVGRNGDLASAYPYQSYLTFSADLELLLGGINPELMLEPDLLELTNLYEFAGANIGFYLGNSGYMKEMLLWVKRIHVKNNGDVQWYDSKSEIPDVVYLVSSGGRQGDFSSYRRTYVDGSLYSSRAINIQFAKETGDELFFTDEFGVFTSTGGETNPTAERNIKYYIEGGLKGYFIVEADIQITGNDYNVAGLGGIKVIQMDVSDTKEGKAIYAKYLLDASSAELGFSVTASNPVPNPANPDLLRIGCSIFNIKYTNVGDKYEYLIESGDMNPIHKIREILTDDTAMGKPESDVNDLNFIKAADRIWDERLGFSWAIDEKSCVDAIEELCYHIEAGTRVNRQTGLYEMVLFRDDWFAEDEIHTIAENKIKDLSLEVMNSDDIVNQLNVTYYDRQRIKNSTFSVYENGSILTMGKANAESIEFPYFMNMRNAEIVANWKLKQFSTPAWSGSFSTGWREARKWNRYDLIRLPWSSKWNGTILVRIMKINLGNGADNTVTIDFEEVIPYSGEMNTSIVVDAPVESAPQPPQPSMNAVFEAPYYLTVLRAGQTNADLELSNNPDIGYVAAIAAKPQNNSLNALLFTDGGVGEFEQVSRLDYCDILQLDQSINETASAFVVTGSLTQTANSNNLILLNDELMGFVSFDTETKVLTVKRGVLDTVPKKHSSGSLFVFDLPDVAFDSTQYAQSEVVEAQVLTTTPSGIQELSGNGQAIEIQARAIRPYPPANVKINGEYWPLYIEDDLLITWSDRNRSQQTGGQIIGYFEPSVTLEPNTQTLLTVTELDADAIVFATHSINATGTNTFTLLKSTINANTRSLHVNLKTVRDGHECLNAFEHTVIRSTLIAPTNVNFEVIEY